MSLWVSTVGICESVCEHSGNVGMFLNLCVSTLGMCESL